MPAPGTCMREKPMSLKDHLTLVPLRERRELLNECVDLLNEQWPRSKGARLRSLEQFGPYEFPVSLLLVENVGGNGKGRLLGHSKILPVPYHKEKCFIESVVISKELRGKGYGRMIMEMTEAYAKRRGVKAVYLTTHDQQGFYAKLGYELCDPIVVFGGCSANIQKLLLQSMGDSDQDLVFKRSCSLGEPTMSNGDTENKSVQKVPNHSHSDALLPNAIEKTPVPLSSCLSAASAITPLPPPPPPPPPPALPKIETGNSKVQILYRPDGSPQSALNGSKMHMRKVLD